MKDYSTIYEELLHLWKVLSLIRFLPNAKNGFKRNRFFTASKRTNDSEVVGRFPGNTVKEISPLVKERTIVKWWGYAFLDQSTKKERKPC